MLREHHEEEHDAQRSSAYHQQDIPKEEGSLIPKFYDKQEDANAQNYESAGEGREGESRLHDRRSGRNSTRNLCEGNGGAADIAHIPSTIALHLVREVKCLV